nr:MAG TPA: repressor domain protein [Caudoviricetes sp.]
MKNTTVPEKNSEKFSVSRGCRLKHLPQGKRNHSCRIIYHSIIESHDLRCRWVPEGKEKILNQLEIFKNREFGEIRTVVIDGEPWFVGKDIAEVLGYSNSRKAVLDHVDDEDKMDGVTIRDAIGRDQAAVVINESGVYALIFGSKLASAKRFKHWVTSEVLPQIRKNGSYQKMLTPEEMMRIQLGMVDDHENRIEHLENTMTIDYGRQQDLKKTVNKRVIEVLGGKKAPAYKEMSKKVFAECNRDIQDYFGVNSRNNIPALQFDAAMSYVDAWNPSNNTILEIRSCNAGMGGADGV